MLKNKSAVFILLAVVLAVLTLAFFKVKYGENAPVFLYLSYLMFAGISIIGYNRIKMASQKSEPYIFVNTYIGLTAIKMFLVLVVLTVYLYFNKAHLFAIGLWYATGYLLFLVVDVWSLLKMLKSLNRK